MESNDDLNKEVVPEEPAEVLPEGRNNLEICPNCLEPNDDDLAICRYCGQPLHPGADVADVSAMPESEQKLAETRAAAAAQENKPKKKQESGFRRVMPWLGLYLIYYAITGVIETSHNEELADVKLAYLSWVIWFAAGILMAWPLIKKGYRKLRHLPEEDEEAEPAADEKTGEDAAAEEAEPAGESNELTDEPSENEAEETGTEYLPEAEAEAQAEDDDGSLPEAAEEPAEVTPEETDEPGAEDEDSDEPGSEEEAEDIRS